MQMIHMLLPQPAYPLNYAGMHSKLIWCNCTTPLLIFRIDAHTTWPLDASLFCTLIF